MTVVDGTLFAGIDHNQATRIAVEESDSKAIPHITLSSHATLLFKYDDFRLLTDP